MDNLIDEFTEDEKKQTCEDCQCHTCENENCPVKCKTFIVCNFKVTNCGDYQ